MTKRKCSIADCESPHLARGYCQNHYAKARRAGHPEAGRNYGKAKGLACAVHDCELSAHALGYCKRHYAAVKTYGSPHRPPRPSLADRLHAYLAPGGPPEAPYRPVPGDCVVFTGCILAGYGRFARGYAHRFAYELHHGPIPDGLHIDHLCRVRACCNPDHLEVVTPSENSLRGAAFRKARAA